MALDEVRARVQQALEAHPEYWCNDGEQEVALRPLIDEVGEAKGVVDIFRTLGPDDFRAH